MALRHVIRAPFDASAIDEIRGPVIYLAGPIQGARDWHTEAIHILEVVAPHVHVASPRAVRFTGSFEGQLRWEAAWVARAARDGAILFWLAKELKHRCDRAYAQQPRFELGEWATRSQHLPSLKIAVGVEHGFTGGPYLERRIATAYPNIPLCRSLRQTCVAAVELVAGQSSLAKAPSLTKLLGPLTSAED